MSDRRVVPSLALLSLLAVLGSARLDAEPVCHEPPARSPIAGASIGLVYDSALAREVVEEAIAVWRSCANYGSDFPNLVHGEATATLFVELSPGTSGTKRCGHFSGRRIVLYRWARTSDLTVRSCGSLALNLAHELGHALGLRDAHDDDDCASTIMADLGIGNLFARRATVEECGLAGARWSTLAEMAGAGASWQESETAPKSSISIPALELRVPE